MLTTMCGEIRFRGVQREYGLMVVLLFYHHVRQSAFQGYTEGVRAQGGGQFLPPCESER